MGVLTCGELIGEVLAAHGNREDLTEERVVRALNMAQDAVAKIFRPNELEDYATEPTTLTENNGVLLFADITPTPVKILRISLRPGDGRERVLTGMSFRQFKAAFPDPTVDTPNIPSVYVKFAKRVELWPIPDAEYPVEIGMRRKATALSVDDQEAFSELDMPDVLLISHAAAYLFRGFGESEKALDHERTFRQGIKETLDQEDSSEPDRIISSETARLGEIVSGSSRPWLDPMVRK